jgi:hypothetical protein
MKQRHLFDTCLAAIVLVLANACGHLNPEKAAHSATHARIAEVVAQATRVDLERFPPREAPAATGSTPVALQSGDLDVLRRACTPGNGIRAREFGIYTACEFHADWRVLFTHGDRQASFLFCFGCNEVLADTVPESTGVWFDFDPRQVGTHFERFKGR